MLLLLAPAFAATLSGRVLDEDGNPLAGVTVVAYDPRLNYATAETTSSGEWSIIRLPGRAYRLRAYAGDDSPWVDRFYPSAWDFCTAQVIEVGEEDVAGGLDFVLPRGGTISGVLLDAAGAPIVGADVYAEGASERTALVDRETVTGADGAYTLVGLDSDPGAAEPYRCRLDTAGWPEQFLGGTYEDADAELVEVRLGEAAEAGPWSALDGILVGGTVYGPDGPVSSGTVFAYASSQVLATSIAADGTWVGDGLPPGEVIAWAESPGLATTYYPDGDRPGDTVAVLEEGAVEEGVDLHLPEENTLSLHFTGEGDFTEVGVMLYNSELTVGRGGGLDEDGRITIHALHDGDYTLYVYGADGGFVDDWVNEGGAPRVFRVTDDTEVELPLGRGATLSGTVTDETGAPVYGAYVYAFPADGSQAAAVSTDDAGAWTMPGLRTGPVTLRFSYANYCPSDPGYVLEYWEDALVEEDADYLEVTEGEAIEGLDVELWLDGDHDGMGDTWEGEHGLDPGRDDAAEDADGDGFSNYEEWILGSDPSDASDGGKGPGCGCGTGGAGLLALPGLAALVRRRGRRAG